MDDDESGLAYMRARYYEAGSGRLASEDPARDGYNWFAYAWNNPINNVDHSGKVIWTLTDLAAAFISIFAYLVASAPEGGMVLGMAIGGSTVVLVTAAVAGAVLTVVGAILTVNAVRDAFQGIMDGRVRMEPGMVTQMVEVFKRSMFTSQLGHQLEIAFAIGELNSGE